MQRIAMLTIGSRGDVQPFIALARGWRQTGYDVVLGASPDFATLAAAYDIPFHPLGIGMREFLQSEDLKAAIAEGQMLRFLRSRLAARRELYAELNREALAVCKGADGIIYKNAVLAGLAIALKQRIPCAEVRLQPYTPTRAFPSFVLRGQATYGPALNWFSGALTQQIVWQMLMGDVRTFMERDLAMPAFSGMHHDQVLARMGVPVIHPISQWLIRRPADWPAHLHLVGSWFLPPPPAWQPPPEVTSFLAAGPPPVYVGFGSMPHQDPQTTFALVAQALEQVGQRGIVAVGWSGIDVETSPAPQILCIEELPHDWLFPQMHVVVHHGGAGTTAAALRAGVPAVVVPFFADQPFWGWRVKLLGVSPPPLSVRTLTANALAKALRQAGTDHTMRRRARAVGALVSAEDGIAQTITLLLQTAPTQRKLRAA